MNFHDYNKSFEEIVDTFEEEADNKLRSIRRQCVRNFIQRLNSRDQEWDDTFRVLLKKSHEIDIPIKSKEILPLASSLFPKSTLFSDLSLGDNSLKTAQSVIDLTKKNKKPEPTTKEIAQAPLPESTKQPTQPKSEQQVNLVLENEEGEFDDPHFSNFIPMKEFVRVQELLEQSRKLSADLSTDPALKSYKNELNLFIRTQINSISNSDSQHLNTKIKLLTSLFNGHRVNFQDRLIDATRHPQGQLFSMELAAQIFVTVGTRLVNSVPAIARSMATVINGIVDNNFPVFKDLVIGHLQECCPYLIPINPNPKDYSEEKEIKYKVACGYSYDSKSQTLESDEKHLARMRSMVLIYACILIQGHMNQTWTWLAAFLSLKPKPVISATILQAFLQESSKKMSSTYGRQYNKMLAFIRNHYVKMIDEVTPKTADRQSFVKLKNLLSDNSNLIATPAVSSIFGTIRFT